MIKKPILHVLIVSRNAGDFHLLQTLLKDKFSPAVEFSWVQDLASGRQSILDGAWSAALVSIDFGQESLDLAREAACSGVKTAIFLLAGEALSPGQLDELDEAALENGCAGLFTREELTPRGLWRAIRYATRDRVQADSHPNQAPETRWDPKGLDEIRQVLQTEPDRLAFLLESINDEVWFSDPEGNLTMLNNRAVRNLGFDTPEDLNLPHSELLKEKLKIYNLDGQLRPIEDAPLFRSLKGETVRGQEMVYHLKTGQPLYREFISSPIRNHQGQIVGAIAVGRDITEQKLAEDRLRALNQSLRASEEQYRTLLESLQEGVWLLDENLITVFVNDRMAAMLGYSVDEIIGQPLSHFLHPDELESLKTEWGRRMAGLPGQIDRRMIHKSGAVLELFILTNPIIDEQGKFHGAIAGVIDMTERRLMLRALEEREEQARRYAEELERSNRDLEQFAFTASHDLQEPLRKIKSFGERLAAGYAEQLDETGQDYLARMISAAGRMQRMISALLAFSRISTRDQQFELVDLRSVASEVVSDLELRIQQSGGSIELGEFPQIEADRTQMYQLLQNLLSNALKFCQKDSPPRVRVTARPAVLPAGKEAIEIVVEDNGIGIPVTQLERIFQPFQRLHGRSEFEGSGIGLPICRKIAERHGGAIRAESEPGQGSRFIVCLPVRRVE